MVVFKNFLLTLFIGFTSVFSRTPAAATPTPLPQVSIFPSATLAPTWSPLNTDADLKLIKNAFAVKYGRKPTDVILTTSGYDGSHFIGTVSFKLAMAGGMLLAAKDADKEWVIVADGNGVIPCEAISSYKFPVSMVSECYNRAGQLVKLK